MKVDIDKLNEEVIPKIQTTVDRLKDAKTKLLYRNTK